MGQLSVRAESLYRAPFSGLCVDSTPALPPTPPPLPPPHTHTPNGYTSSLSDKRVQIRAKEAKMSGLKMKVSAECLLCAGACVKCFYAVSHYLRLADKETGSEGLRS